MCIVLNNGQTVGELVFKFDFRAYNVCMNTLAVWWLQRRILCT